MELVDTPDLGSGGESLGGSSPSARTKQKLNLINPDAAEDESKND